MKRSELMAQIQAAAPEEWQRLVVVTVKVALLEALTDCERQATGAGRDALGALFASQLCR